VTLSFRCLYPVRAPRSLGLDEFLDALSFPADPERALPHVALNAVCTVDGRTTIAGRSGPIGGSADRELFHGLRTLVDAVMIGAETLRVERYNRLVDDPAARRQRLERGLAEEPLACVVSRSLALDSRIPLLANPAARVVILTPSSGSIGPTPARVRYIRAQRGGELDLPACMRLLNSRLAVRTLLCEGGPHLSWQLLAASLLDELFITLGPMLVSGDLASAAARPSLPVFSGTELDPPAKLELISVLEASSYLFLRYRISR
jgi:riboflavin biosynthesis pyrimidine reductase